MATSHPIDAPARRLSVSETQCPNNAETRQERQAFGLHWLRSPVYILWHSYWPLPVLLAGMKVVHIPQSSSPDDHRLCSVRGPQRRLPTNMKQHWEIIPSSAVPLGLTWTVPTHHQHGPRRKRPTEAFAMYDNLPTSLEADTD